MGAGEECASASVHPCRAVALSAFVFICAEVEAALKSETAGGGGWGEEAEEGRASPSPSVPSPLHASGPHPIPDAAPPPPSPPGYNFSLGASYKPTIYLHYAPEIAICRFAGKK